MLLVAKTDVAWDLSFVISFRYWFNLREMLLTKDGRPGVSPCCEDGRRESFTNLNSFCVRRRPSWCSEYYCESCRTNFWKFASVFFSVMDFLLKIAVQKMSVPTAHVEGAFARNLQNEQQGSWSVCWFKTPADSAENMCQSLIGYGL